MCALNKRSHRVFCRAVQCADHDRLQGGKAASSLENPPKMPHRTAGPLSCPTNEQSFPFPNSTYESSLSARLKAAEKFLKILIAVSPSMARLCGHSVCGPNEAHLRA